jgi:flagella basal body P-ring formation protein FlgA
MACAARLAFLLAAGLAGYAGAAAAAPGREITIELRPRVTVSEPRVRLGDVAFLTTRDLPTLRQLMALPLGPAPRPGTPASLDRETIERWVMARTGLPSSPVRWTGASETEIESAAQQFSGENIVLAARSALLKWLSERSVRAEIQALSGVRDLVLPAGTPTLRVRPLASHGLPSKRMLVWVDAWVDDRFVRTTAVSFEVGAWAPLSVASAGLELGAALDPVVRAAAFEEREIDLTTVRRGTPVDAAGGQRLKRPLRAGEVLTNAHLEAVPAVTRGNWAHLLARSGDVSVESRVEVLQDGRAGQVVRVKVPGSSGEVLARVTGPGQVEVQP